MWWLLGIALAAVAAIVIAMTMNGQTEEPTTIPVPTIAADITAEEARSQIEAAGLTFERAIDKDSDLAEGQTTGVTDPTASTPVEPDSTVTVFVAGAPGQVNIPDVKNLSEADARARLEEENLTVSGTETENSPDITQGMVTKSEPGAGQTVEEGSEVVLYLSTGNTELPNIVGQTREAAEPQLADIGLGTINWDEEPSDEVPEGSVARTDPEAGDVPRAPRHRLHRDGTGAPGDDRARGPLRQDPRRGPGRVYRCADHLPGSVAGAFGHLPGRHGDQLGPGARLHRRDGCDINLVVSSGPADGGGEGTARTSSRKHAPAGDSRPALEGMASSVTR